MSIWGMTNFIRWFKLKWKAQKYLEKTDCWLVTIITSEQKGILYNGVNYKQDKKIKEYDDEMLKAFGLTMSEGDLVSLNTIEKEWQFAFYNGQYYVVHYDDNGKNIKIFSMKKAD